MNRLIISLCFIFLTSGLSAQDSIDGFMELFGWVKKLDDNISSIVRTENKKKLVRQIGYLQSDLDNFIDQKREITDKLIQHCTDSSVTITEVEKEVDYYNDEVKILTNRVREIRKTIIFKDDLYSVTEKRVVTKYRKSDSTDLGTSQYVVINGDSVLIQSQPEIANDPIIPANAMVQHRVMDIQNMPPQEVLIPDGDTTIEVTYTKNKNEWKEVDTEHLFLEIEKSLSMKGSNMSYMVEYLSKDCNLELIEEESEMAVTVLTNIRNEFRTLRGRIREYEPIQ
ncbi:MAG: hypothetical protein ABFS16_03690 [Bacteroidota bacterium]